MVFACQVVVFFIDSWAGDTGGGRPVVGSSSEEFVRALLARAFFVAFVRPLRSIWRRGKLGASPAHSWRHDTQPLQQRRPRRFKPRTQFRTAERPPPRINRTQRCITVAAPQRIAARPLSDARDRSAARPRPSLANRLKRSSSRRAAWCSRRRRSVAASSPIAAPPRGRGRRTNRRGRGSASGPCGHRNLNGFAGRRRCPRRRASRRRTQSSTSKPAGTATGFPRARRGRAKGSA